MKTLHIGVSLDYLAGLIREHGNYGIITQGKRSLSKTKALGLLAEEAALGRTVASNCPTPLPDGSCPGHTVT